MELVLLCVALANDSNEVRRQAELDARRTRMVGSLPSHQLTQHLYASFRKVCLEDDASFLFCAMLVGGSVLLSTLISL